MNIRIFIFEDEWHWTEAISSVIQREEDMEVLGDSGNVTKGLEMVNELKPDIILLDIWLENDCYGIEIIEDVLNINDQIKIIIYTSDMEETHLYAAVNAGASGYLLKKEVNDPSILLQAIRAVYHGDNYITPALTKTVINVIKSKNKNGLTRREIEILKLIEQGKTNKEIAVTFNISIKTVINHVSNILYKLGARNRTEAVKRAQGRGY